MHDFGSVESQPFSDSKIIKSLQKLTELWRFQTHRGNKGKAAKLFYHRVDCLHQNIVKSETFKS